MSIKKKILETIGAGAFIALSSSVAQAALVNGTFEADNAQPGDLYCASGWSCFEGVANVHTDNTGGGFAPVSHDAGGFQSIKMFGPFTSPGAAAGAFQTDNSVVAGQTYELTAWAMNWVGDPIQGADLGILQLTFWDGPNGTGNQLGAALEEFASADGAQNILLPVEDGADISDWTRMSVSGVAPAGTQSAKAFLLKIQTGCQSGGVCNGGSFYWDDVSLTASAIPVPAAVWLFGSGLLGLVGVARRRKG